MIDIPAIFKSRTLDADKLREYGFSYSGDQYTMDFPIMENQYTAKITISSDGSADFRVYETDSDEEYMPAHIYNATGAFVGGIHKACEEILKNYHLVTARRPDTDYAEGLKKIESFREKYGADIIVLNMIPVDASSTEIRNLIKEGKPLTGLVPPEVEEYIIEHKLYR